ncbi:MAG: flagellar filament capping protein FliD [Vibrio sp.]
MNIDAASMAAQWASYEVTPFETRYNTRLSELNSQSSALRSIETALNSLDDIIYKYTKPGATLSQSSTTLSQEDYFDISTSGNVQDVNMDLFVQQMATSQQMVLETNSSDPQGTFMEVSDSENQIMTVNIGGKDISIDLKAADSSADGNVSYTEFVNHFNKQMDGKVNATLVRSDGDLKLMFSSEETGAENLFKLSSNVASVNVADATIVTAAQDAIVMLGGENGVQLTNSSNTFEDIVDGIDITLKKPQETGAASVNVKVGKDMEATTTALNEFITEYNALIDELDKQTQSGSETEARGVLASDSSVRNIRSQMSSILRQDFNGTRLFEIGISIDRDGKLELDSDKFEEASKTVDIEAMFTGENGVFKTFETTIDQYTNYTTGSLKTRQESISQQQSRINDSLDALDSRYDMYYNRYLAQFSQLNTIMTNMNSISGMFV